MGEPSREGTPRTGGVRRLAIAAAPLVAVVLGLYAVHDLNRHPGILYSLLLLGSGSLVWAAWIYRRDGPSLLGVLAVGVVLRGILAPLPPALSDDVYRYLWDGHVLVSGENPYVLAPDAEELRDLREEPWGGIWRSVAHRSVETVYPPVAMLLFSIAALSDAPFVAYKVLLVSLDLLGCGLLFLLAVRHGYPRNRVLLYAWNPIVLLEGAAMGHVDALGLAPLAAGLLFLSPRDGCADVPPRSSACAGGMLALGILIKLVPVVLAPVWLAATRRRRELAAAVLVVLLLAGLPVLMTVGGLPAGLVTYGVHWEFNGPVYEPLWRVLSGMRVTDLAFGTMSFLESISGIDLFAGLKQWVWPQLLAKVAMAAAFVVLLVGWLKRPRRSFEGRRSVRATGLVIGGALLLTATFYPWYLLWVLPWAALERSAFWLTLSVTLPFAYLPSLVAVTYFPFIWLLVWAPPLVAFGLDRAAASTAAAWPPGPGVHS